MLPKSEPSKCPSRRPGAGQKRSSEGSGCHLPPPSHPPRVSPRQTDRLTDVGPVPAVSQRLWMRHGDDQVESPTIGGGGRGSALPRRRVGQDHATCLHLAVHRYETGTSYS